MTYKRVLDFHYFIINEDGNIVHVKYGKGDDGYAYIVETRNGETWSSRISEMNEILGEFDIHYYRM